jgi:hypothetical protein
MPVTAQSRKCYIPCFMKSTMIQESACSSHAYDTYYKTLHERSDFYNLTLQQCLLRYILYDVTPCSPGASADFSMRHSFSICRVADYVRQETSKKQTVRYWRWIWRKLVFFRDVGRRLQDYMELYPRRLQFSYRGMYLRLRKMKWRMTDVTLQWGVS